MKFKIDENLPTEIAEILRTLQTVKQRTFSRTHLIQGEALAEPSMISLMEISHPLQFRCSEKR
jgi:hypothetical protein